MNIVLTVFKKEVKVTFRDKRTLFTSIILPSILIPLMILGVGKFQKNLLDKEKKKSITDGYEPTVSVKTKKVGDKILISVKDNGSGIPQKIIDKIYY